MRGTTEKMDGKNEMKIVIEYEDTDGCDPDGKPIERVSYSCPTCHKNYLPPFIDRCPECRQLLRW
jgi:predicted RNA-binding Zn-ribbon protein involved in translation (DUF1610 family)